MRTVAAGDIKNLRSALRGELILRDHAAYEAARRVWNGNIDRRPALIARCTGVADVQQADTAFAARQPQWDFDAIGTWTDGAASSHHIAWVRALWSRLEPHLQGSAYVNHLAEDDRPEKVRASFGEHYGRLRQIKAIYDPMNLFRINANIEPT